MRIECENCGAAYTIGDTLISDQPIGAQCPYCGHVKVVQKGDDLFAAGPSLAPPLDDLGGGLGRPPAFDLDGPALGEPAHGMSVPPSASDAFNVSTGMTSVDPFGGLASGLGDPLAPGGASGAIDDRFGTGDSIAPGAGSDGGRATCQVCGTELIDEFDKVIGLCETHQRDRGGATDAAPRVADESGEFTVRRPDGSEAGTFSLTELRSKLTRGEISPDAEVSVDGEAFAKVDAKVELKDYISSFAHGAPPPAVNIQIPQQRTFIAQSRTTRSRFGVGTFVLLVLLVAAAGGAYFAYENPERAEKLWAEIRGGKPPEKPRAPNPLRPLLDQWRVIHRDVSGTPEEHVLAARAAHLEDNWPAYAKAEASLQRALLLDEDNPTVTALYIENLVIWKGELLDRQEIRSAEAALDFAVKVAPDDAGVHRARAALELARGDLNGCRQWAAKALGIDATDAQAKLLHASSFLEGNGPLATKEAESAKSLKPDLKRADRLLAQAYANAGRYSTAIEILDARLKEDPRNVAVHILYGDIEQRLMNRDAALSHYAQAARGQGNVTSALIAKGTLEFESRDNTAAAKTFARALKDESAPAKYRSISLAGLGSVDVERGRWRQAAELINESLEIDPRNAAALIARGEIALQTGSATTAAAYAQRALDVRGGEPSALVLLGRAAVAQRNADEALKRFEEAVGNDQRDARLRGILASMYLAFGGSSQAFAVMRQVADLDPRDRSSRAGKGLLRLSFWAQQEAIDRFQKASTDQRNRSVANAAVGLMLYHMDESAKARAAIERALEADESNVTARLYECQLALEFGAQKKAEEAGRTILDIDRASAIGHLMLARVFAAGNKHRDAKEEYESALRSSPGMMVAKVELVGLNLGGKTVDPEDIEVLKEAHRLYPHVLLTRRLLLQAKY